jgi:hypothetical protein
VDEHGVSRLNEIGTVRLLSLLGNSLAAMCVIATIGTGCTSPSATGARDGIASGSSSPEPSAPSAPRFAAGGPDAEDYGANNGYPIGDRSTFFRIPFLVGSQSRFDQIFEGRLIRRATTTSRLERVNSEPALRYEFGGGDPRARRLPRAQPGHRPPRRARRHDPHRALPVRPERSASHNLVVDG